MIESDLTREASVGDIVTIDLQLEAENFVPDSLFDRVGRISFVLGWGNYLPGLHEVLEGKRRGDLVEKVSIDAGWGSRRKDLIFTISIKKLLGLIGEAEAIECGNTVHLQGKVPVLISKIDNDNQVVELDANPPMAGASYTCSLKVIDVEPSPANMLFSDSQTASQERYQVATFALGCFWGAELAFMRVKGVVGTQVGYTQGTVANPTYQQVCTGSTKHREAVRIVFDSKAVSYAQLLSVATERLADTTSSLEVAQNQLLFAEEDDEENDQYKRGMYFHNACQQREAQNFVEETKNRYQVELGRASNFYLAEDYHQQYLYKGGQSARKGAKEPIRCFE